MKPIRIILIDDDPSMKTYLTVLFKDYASYDVLLKIVACDTTAIQKCKDFQPDIIIITHGAATLHKGLELARHMMKDSYIKQRPVIMLSTLGEEDDVKCAMDLGISDYLQYPIYKEHLFGVVDRIVYNKYPTILDKALQLYEELTDEKYASRPFQKTDLGENMELVEEVIGQYWKPRFIINNAAHTAFEFMDGNEQLMTVCENDIMWETLEGMTGYDRAKSLNAHYPTRIRKFAHGMAEVSWQINPDGRYFMDDDGYGMTDDEEETIYGYINKHGRVVAKFRAIADLAELEKMQLEAWWGMNKI